jgi:hypothetical protein
VLACGRTTAAPADEVTALFPGIEQYAVTATRLHPRGGTPDPYGSHVGGQLRWPAGEPWPSCSAEHVVATEVPIPAPLLTRLERLRAGEPARRWAGYQAVVAELASQRPGFIGINRRAGGLALYQVAQPQPAPSPLVALAQLRTADVPDLRPPPGTPPGTDLLQVLWCPNDHDLGSGSLAPAVTLRWRCEAEVTGVPARPPAPTAVGHQAYLPRPCLLHPEQVVEYPWWQQLPADLAQQVRAWDAEHDGRYHRELATAPGWKVGGWPQWPTSDPLPMYCTRCGTPMRQLLQIDSSEWSDPARWRPLEDRDLAAPEPTGVIAGHTGLYRIFTCPSCPAGTPPEIDLQ